MCTRRPQRTNDKSLNTSVIQLFARTSSIQRMQGCFQFGRELVNYISVTRNINDQDSKHNTVNSILRKKHRRVKRHCQFALLAICDILDY